MWTFYAIAIITVVVMDLVTLFHYASPKADWMVKSVVAYAWFTNLSIVILVPIDVYTVSLEELPPSSEKFLSSDQYIHWDLHGFLLQGSILCNPYLGAHKSCKVDVGPPNP